MCCGSSQQHAQAVWQVGCRQSSHMVQGLTVYQGTMECGRWAVSARPAWLLADCLEHLSFVLDTSPHHHALPLLLFKHCTWVQFCVLHWCSVASEPCACMHSSTNCKPKTALPLLHRTLSTSFAPL